MLAVLEGGSMSCRSRAVAGKPALSTTTSAFSSLSESEGLGGHSETS
jgi:hypothetical protein